MSSRVLVSRSDKLGDLVLALPAVAHLKKHLTEMWKSQELRPRQEKPEVILHVSKYARSIGEWAHFNGICDSWFATDEPAVVDLQADFGLSLFHSSDVSTVFKKCVQGRSLGPRSKLSSLWTYSKTIAQNRSQVRKSEMEYNVDLADAFLAQLAAPFFGAISRSKYEFHGLKPLRVPDGWSSSLANAADVLIVASNGNSALNASMQRYLEVANEELSRGSSVDFLINGADAPERIQEFLASPLGANIANDNKKVRMIEGFESIVELIAHISQVKKVYSSSTGPLHIAHALGKELHAFFPRKPLVQSFERWRPHGYWSDSPVYLEHIRS